MALTIIIIAVISLAVLVAFFIKLNRSKALNKNKRIVEYARMKELYKEKCRDVTLAAEQKEALSSGNEPTGQVGKEASTADKDEFHWRLFCRMEQLMDTEKLYLQQDLSREKMCKLMKTDKNHMAKMFQLYVEEANLPAYINSKRVCHAAYLIKEKPYCKMATIATESGFSTVRSFNRLFKEQTGMTPLEFREVMLKR